MYNGTAVFFGRPSSDPALVDNLGKTFARELLPLALTLLCLLVQQYCLCRGAPLLRQQAHDHAPLVRVPSDEDLVPDFNSACGFGASAIDVDLAAGDSVCSQASRLEKTCRP